MEQTILQLPMQPRQEFPPLIQSGRGVVYPPPQVPLISIPVLPDAPDPMPDIPISKRRLEILKALVSCQDLTIDQLQRWLRLSPASVPYLREHVRELQRHGFVEVQTPAKQTLYGRSPNVYSFGPAARKYLRSQGLPVPTRYRSLKERLHKQYPIRHTLAVNEVLVQARNLRWDVPDLALNDYRHEKVLNANPLVIPLPEREKPYRLSPDLWLKFTHPMWDFFCCVEVNLSEVSQRDWRERVRAYLYSLKPYNERFGTKALVVLTIVQTQSDFPKTTISALTPEEVLEREEAAANRRLRCRNLVKWTAAELTELQTAHLSSMFWFTDKRLQETAPTDLFYGRHWRLPNHSGLHSPMPPGTGGEE